MVWIPLILILPYVLLLLNYYRSLRHVKSFHDWKKHETLVSVVVACRNEENNLPNLLNCLDLQNYPQNLFEIIIVNDNSTDRTFETVFEFNGINNLSIIENQGKGKKQALRTGINIARGDLIITTDADCSMGENWIRTIASFYELNLPDMIICPVQLESQRGIFTRFQELEFLSLQGITSGCALSEKSTMCNGANLAFKREVYLDHSTDLHDEISSGDDIFLLQSIKKKPGSKILWLESADAMVITKPSSTLSSFLKQRSRWISKGKAYSDRDTIILGTATFAAVMLQFLYFAGIIWSSYLIWIFLVIFILKSIPDYLILSNTAIRYNRTNLMIWFSLFELLYPLYVISVVCYTFLNPQSEI
jgi:biofilm PGA synthesis N-glycosyltransferase PgaC